MLEIPPASRLLGFGYSAADRWVSLYAMCSPALLLCRLWTASSSSRTASLAMPPEHRRLRYVPLAWTAPCMPAQHWTIQAWLWGQGSWTCCGWLWYFSPIPWWAVLAFGSLEFCILLPGVLTALSAWVASFPFQKAILGYFYLEIP